MESKKTRQNTILELIQNEEIGTQEALSDRLRERGFEVTQATVSRDIRELKLSKLQTGDGGYRYAAMNQKNAVAPAPAPVGFHSMLEGTAVSVTAAGNMIVLRTPAGLAQPVALGIDSMGDAELLGCIAGDDTVFVVTPTPETAQRKAEMLRRTLA